MVKLIAFIIINILCFIGCSPIHLKSSLYTGTLKLNGVYTHEVEGNRDYCDCLFLYSNGVIVNAGVVSDCNMSELTKAIPSMIFNSRYHWGVFTVDTINITLKRWYPGINSPFLISTGNIINDSTFVLNEVTNQYCRHEFAIQDTFHFQYLELKPDSASKFIISKPILNLKN